LRRLFEDGDPALITAAIGDIARARGMTKIAKSAGLSRETMYKAFSADGNPTLETLAEVTRALGYRLSIAPLPAPKEGEIIFDRFQHLGSLAKGDEGGAATWSGPGDIGRRASAVWPLWRREAMNPNKIDFPSQGTSFPELSASKPSTKYAR
jgi:probable addiction module antidote protein